MKQYICLNHGECNWADENPPREFPLPDGEEQFCPNCGSNNIKEKEKLKGPPWFKVAAVLGLVLLITGLVWFLWPVNKKPLLLLGELNCDTGILSIATTGGDSTAITFRIEGLSSSNNNEFLVPISLRKGKEFKLSATQNGITVDTTYITHCSVLPPPPPPPPPGHDTSPSPQQITYKKVEGSEFCISDCVLGYSEIDNLGRVRERRVENYAKCCPANKYDEQDKK